MFPWLNPSRIFFRLTFTLGLFNYCYLTHISVSLHLTPMKFLFAITAPICYKCVNETRSWLSYRHLDVKNQLYFNMHSRIYGSLINGTFISTVLVKQCVCMYICDNYILYAMYYDVSVIITR